MRTTWTLTMMVAAAACATDDKGPEDDIPADDAKADSFAKPTDHGAVAFGAAQRGSLTGSAEYHTWTFSLGGDAQIHAFTSRWPHAATLDTVLYLYKKTASGTWGSYVARNDDASSTTRLSSITKSLGAGDYRVLVKGYNTSVKGPFGVEVDCSGAGCTPVASGCVFGTFQDDFLNGVDTNLLHNKHTYTSAAQYTADHLAPVFDADIIAALRESGHTEVTTVAQAFAAADQGTIDIDHVYDLVGARAFVAIEFGAGDNPVGAIFADGTGAKVAGLHDSDITDCTTPKQTCQLHQNFGDLRQDAAWHQLSKITVTSASSLSGTQAANALAAIQVAYDDATTLAMGLGKIDQGELDVMVLDNAGTRVEVYDYGAGDNTYGAMYVAGTATLAAEIHDGDHYKCSLLQ